MVEPARAISSKVRTDDGKSIDVREISEDHVSLSAKVCEPGKAWSGTRDLPAVPAEPFRDWWQRTGGGKEGTK